MDKEYVNEVSDYTDTLKIYKNEIGNVSLLTSEEEIELSKRILAGDKEAKKELVEKNLLLVMSVINTFSGYGLSQEDLIQEGNIGLIKAANYFDYRKGYRFSTYAVPAIKQEIIRAIGKTSRTVRISNYMSIKMGKVKSCINSLAQSFGREPTDAEVANELEMTEKEVRDLKIIFQPVGSLNSYLFDEEDNELIELIEDERDFYAEIFQEDIGDNIWKLFDIFRLNYQEVDVLLNRCGFYGKVYTLKELGDIYGVSREMIRRVEAKAIKKIAGSKHAGLLADFMENAEEAIRYLKCKFGYNVEYVYDEPNSLILLSIYKFFKQYSKKEIDEVIENLNTDEYYCFFKRYGENLSNPKLCDLSNLESKYFYTEIVPNMKKMLDENRVKNAETCVKLNRKKR